jgi:RHS repeat-associated protein
LGSTTITTWPGGAKKAELRYRAFGETRYTSGTMPTSYRFTGQREDSYTQLYQMGVRWYDPSIGRWIQPDTIIPDPTNPQSLNRYAYVYNNALRFVDPSGYDPLDAAWEEEFRRANGRDPTDRDKRDRLFSLLFPGSDPGGSWTEEDWKRYAAADIYDKITGDYLGNEFWKRIPWDPADSPSVQRFAKHVGRLAAWYSEGEEDLFVRAFAFVFAGIPYSGSSHLAAASVAGGPKVWQPLEEGEAGWEALWVEPGDNPAHHYADLLFAGYHYGDAAYYVNALRDFDNAPDYVLGAIGVIHGQWLRGGIITPWLLDVNIMYMLSAEHPRDLQSIRQSLGQ